MADGLLSQPITARDAFGHGGLPMDLNPDDTPVGYDDAGMPVFRGRTGQTYYVKAQPQSPEQSQGILSMLAAVPAGVAQSIWDAVSAPANAARGKAVTLEDVWNTAGMAQAGAAPAKAPKGAARSGALRTMADDAITPAQRVAEMLRSGRAADVTDDLMAQVDPQEMARLYESGATGADMAMDQASRMARAREMGFDTSRSVYHGTPDNRDVLAAGRFQSTGRPVYTSDKRAVAATYADDARAFDYQNADPSIFELYRRPVADASIDAGGATFRGIDAAEVSKSTGATINPASIRPDGKISTANLEKILKDQGFSGAEVKNVIDTYTGRGPKSSVQMTFDPRNLRSTSARFDPRLAHLANLSAGVGAMAYGIGQTDEDRKRGIFDYLAKGGM